MTIPSNKAYTRGLWSVRLWPLIILSLFVTLILYLVFNGNLDYTPALYMIGVGVIAAFIWSQYAIGRWKMWMVSESDNPKITIEKARSGFLSIKMIENLAFMSSNARKEYAQKYDERMSAIRAIQMDSAHHKFDLSQTISLHQKLSGTFQFLLFEIVIIISAIFLFVKQEELTIRLISGTLVIILIMGIFYTFKTLIRKNRTVLEVNQRGIRINKKYYGWGDLDSVDVVKGDTLIYTPRGEKQLERRVDKLSMPAEYIDDVVLYYYTSFVNEKDNTSS